MHLLLRLHDLGLDLLQLLLLFAIFRPVLNFIEHLLELLDVLHLFFHLEVVDLVLLDKLVELVELSFLVALGLWVCHLWDIGGCCWFDGVILRGLVA